MKDLIKNASLVSLMLATLPRFAHGAFGVSPSNHRRMPFSSSPTSTTDHLSTRSRSTALFGLLDQHPGESDTAYFRRLHDISSDAVTFERNVMLSATASNSTDAGSSYQPQSSSGSEAPVQKKKGGYQRAEDWDAELQSKRGTLSWEERVQFDGQRLGNQVRQNDILRHHLNAF